jgi:ankyrin repeat protein
MELEDELRAIVARDPSQLERPMSRNENHQRPLHFAVRMNRPRMVALLLALGADPQGTDGDGYPAAAYATTPASALALAEWDSTVHAVRTDGARAAGALHLLAKRGDAAGVRALLARGADPDARWSHWGAEVTALHLAALHGHAEVVRALLDAGADTTIHDSMHDSDPAGWAEHAGQLAIAAMLREAGEDPPDPNGQRQQG